MYIYRLSHGCEEEDNEIDHRIFWKLEKGKECDERIPVISSRIQRLSKGVFHKEDQGK